MSSHGPGEGLLGRGRGVRLSKPDPSFRGRVAKRAESQKLMAPWTQSQNTKTGICEYELCNKPKAKRADAKYCSRKCKTAAWRFRARRDADGARRGTCVECGALFAHPEGGQGRRRSRCPEHDAASPADCSGCGKRMRSKTATGLCRACKPKALGRQSQAKPFQQVCRVCGGSYLGNWRQDYCSVPCRGRAALARRQPAAAGGRPYRLTTPTRTERTKK